MELKCPYCDSNFKSSGLQVHFCPSCGRRVDLSRSTDAPVTPEPGTPEQDTTPGAPPLPPGPGAPAAGEPPSRPTPWERRRELGFFSAYWQNWKETVLSPDQFWESAPPTGSIWDALSFAWITTAITTVLSLPLTLLQMSGNRASMEELLTKMEVPPQVHETLLEIFAGGTFTVVYTLLIAVLYPLTFIIGCGMIHLLCLLFGCSKNGFVATARASGYASAPLLFSWVPCANVAAVLYSLVLQVWGIAKLQRSSYVRAALVFVTLFVLLCCCTCLIVLALAAPLLGNK